MHMREIVSGIYALEGLRMGRSYLIDDRDGLTLIDTSSPGATPAIMRAIDQLRRPMRDLKTIVATHYHFDHTGNAAELRERSGARVYAHADDIEYIDGRKPWGTGREPAFMSMLAPKPFAMNVDVQLTGGEILPAAGGLEIIPAPGHTPGQIALYSAERRVLFCADALMNTGGLQLPAGPSTHDMLQAKMTIVRLAALDFEHALPGHGQPLMNRANEKIAQWARTWL